MHIPGFCSSFTSYHRFHCIVPWSRVRLASVCDHTRRLHQESRFCSSSGSCWFLDKIQLSFNAELLLRQMGASASSDESKEQALATKVAPFPRELVFSSSDAKSTDLSSSLRIMSFNILADLFAAGSTIRVVILSSHRACSQATAICPRGR